MRRGRPILGFFSGLILGAAIGVFLQQAGVWPFDRLSGIVLPIVLAVLGVLWAFWAPLGGRR